MLTRIGHQKQRSVLFSFRQLFATSSSTQDPNSASKNPRRDIFWWNSAITSCFKDGQIERACQYFNQMPHKNVVTWNCMIAGYIQNGNILDAQRVFDAMPTKNVVSWAALMTGYAKCGRIDEARKLFDRIPERNVVCWNSMISAYLNNGKIRDARQLFDSMPVRNSASWSIIISGYLRLQCVAEARSLFDRAGLRSTSLCNALLSRYVELGHLKDAHELFSQMNEKDTITWNCMITCYSRAGKMNLARNLFDKMSEKDTISWTAIVRGYLRNGNIEDAHTLFKEMPDRDVMAWNTMMAGFVGKELLDEALSLFAEMPERDIVSWNIILQGYIQRDDMVNALRWFEKMPRRSETSWNTLISGYRSEEAVALFHKMVSEKFRPDQGTLAVVLSVCANLVALGWGRMVHLYVIRAGYEHDAFVMSSLISMYSSCGLLDESALAFECTVRRDTIAWNAMIAAYAYHGLAMEAFKLFDGMLQGGFRPDGATFLSLLLACSHKGLVDAGCRYFMSMQRDWNLDPKPEHYSSVVDLLGRFGLVEQAYRFMKEIPIDAQANAWETLLSACRFHGNVQLGEVAARKVLRAQPSDGAMYVAVSSIYAAKGRWEDSARIRALMRGRGLKKELGSSWIEVKGKMYSFVCNDNSPLVEEISRELDNISILAEETN